MFRFGRVLCAPALWVALQLRVYYHKTDSSRVQIVKQSQTKSLKN